MSELHWPRNILAKLFLARNKENNNSAVLGDDSAFAGAYEQVERAVAFATILGKMKGGRIRVDDLADLLEDYPNFVGYITKEELEMAVNSTSDHGVALRLERIMRGK